MKWSPLLLTASLLLATPAAWATTGRTLLGFRTGVDGPRTTRVVLRDEPVLLRVPDSRVYVVRNSGIDMFRYGSTYYAMRDGWWYRSSSPRGTYRIIDVERVPRAILVTPANHWRNHPHGGPPGQLKKMRNDDRTGYRYDRDRDRDRRRGGR